VPLYLNSTTCLPEGTETITVPLKSLARPINLSSIYTSAFCVFNVICRIPCDSAAGVSSKDEVVLDEALKNDERLPCEVPCGVLCDTPRPNPLPGVNPPLPNPLPLRAYKGKGTRSADISTTVIKCSFLTISLYLLFLLFKRLTSCTYPLLNPFPRNPFALWIIVSIHPYSLCRRWRRNMFIFHG
jgi:hypothetical protein